ncbi:DUF523 domain-containing protein [Kitasatospora sp. NPDC057542]|uniref:DUF523 domain-containing protein n=1 Tax=Kitasatospora sp. NPDC057542 TaxID=3346162 RepID=UPI0036BA2654
MSNTLLVTRLLPRPGSRRHAAATRRIRRAVGGLWGLRHGRSAWARDAGPSHSDGAPDRRSGEGDARSGREDPNGCLRSPAGSDVVRQPVGTDVTDEFVDGAHQALATAGHSGCTEAALTARSPSCGCGEIYDRLIRRSSAPKRRCDGRLAASSWNPRARRALNGSAKSVSRRGGPFKMARRSNVSRTM